jgi:hypothetical protein
MININAHIITKWLLMTFVCSILVQDGTEPIDNPLHEGAKRGNLTFLKECLSNKVCGDFRNSITGKFMTEILVCMVPGIWQVESCAACQLSMGDSRRS